MMIYNKYVRLPESGGFLDCDSQVSILIPLYRSMAPALKLCKRASLFPLLHVHIVPKVLPRSVKKGIS